MELKAFLRRVQQETHHRRVGQFAALQCDISKHQRAPVCKTGEQHARAAALLRPHLAFADVGRYRSQLGASSAARSRSSRASMPDPDQRV